MITRILAAYDGSEAAGKAYGQALDLAIRYDAVLDVLAVAQPPDFGDNEETQALLENMQEHFTAQFTPLRERAAQGGANAAFEVRVGHPAEQIVRLAEERKSDLIVVGHRGKGLFERWLLGSIARMVIAYAHCAVLVVR